MLSSEAGAFGLFFLVYELHALADDREQDRLQRADVETKSEYRLFDPVKDTRFGFFLLDSDDRAALY